MVKLGNYSGTRTMPDGCVQVTKQKSNLHLAKFVLHFLTKSFKLTKFKELLHLMPPNYFIYLEEYKLKFTIIIYILQRYGEIPVSFGSFPWTPTI